MRIGIIGAMNIEVERLTDHLEDAWEHVIAGSMFTEGKLGGVPVVVVMCGVGKVNAALCAQVLINRFDVTHVINTGVAGSLDARINIGDLVVSTDAVYHDVDATNFDYEPGQVPHMDVVAFPTDEEMRRVFVQVAHQAAPEIDVYEGRVATGDQFVRTPEEKQRIVDQFGALCCEMEGTAIAHTCYLNDIPCVIARAISDKADGSDAESYPVFEAKAADCCARIVELLVEGFNLPED